MRKIVFSNRWTIVMNKKAIKFYRLTRKSLVNQRTISSHFIWQTLNFYEIFLMKLIRKLACPLFVIRLIIQKRRGLVFFRIQIKEDKIAAFLPKIDFSVRIRGELWLFQGNFPNRFLKIDIFSFNTVFILFSLIFFRIKEEQRAVFF